MDKLKGYLLIAIIGGSLLTVLLFLIDWFGSDFWIWFSIIAAVVILAMNMFYTSLILPLFNKLSPLPDGELKSAIESFSKKVDIPLYKCFFLRDRSEKENCSLRYADSTAPNRRIGCRPCA
jgi:STE24 endopeptidase